MPNPIELKAPDATLLYEFDWTQELPEGVTLVSVVHSAPAPLQMLEEQTDAASGTSIMRIGGGAHGALYVVTALATLSDGEQVPAQFTMRVLQPPVYVNG